LDVKPERGIIEVKGLAQDISGLEQTSQVRGYLEHYGQIPSPARERLFPA
jgi:hypothetical protein